MPNAHTSNQAPPKLRCKVIIEGAGIAGLTLANCLQQLGIEYYLVEKSASLSAIGAGIALQNNGLAILHALGLAEELSGCTLSKMILQSQFQQQVIDAKQGWVAKMVHRADLQQALLSGIDASRLLLDSQIKDSQDDGQQVSATLHTGQQIQADFHILAAGIHAPTAAFQSQRNGQSQTVVHTQAKLRDSQQWCWRTVIKGNASIDYGGEYWLGRHRIGVAPIGAGQFYVYQVMSAANEANNAERLALWQQAQFQALFAHLQFDPLALANASWLSHPLQERQIEWGSPRHIAIGDAAHALTPNMGQGAVLAMEDAYCLAQLMAKQSTHPLQAEPLFKRFITLRHARVSAVQRQSWQAGKVAHWQQPMMVWLRDGLLRCIPTRLLIRRQRQWLEQFTRTMTPLVHQKSHNQTSFAPTFEAKN